MAALFLETLQQNNMEIFFDLLSNLAWAVCLKLAKTFRIKCDFLNIECHDLVKLLDRYVVKWTEV